MKGQVFFKKINELVKLPFPYSLALNHQKEQMQNNPLHETCVRYTNINSQNKQKKSKNLKILFIIFIGCVTLSVTASETLVCLGQFCQ